MNSQRHARALTAALLGIMTVPVAAQQLLGSVLVREDSYAIFRSLDDDGMNFHGQDIRQDVLDYRGTFRAQRRAYSRAVDRCRDRLRSGEDIECPEFNDPASYGEPVHAAADEQAPAEEQNDLDGTRELTTRERELLRTYTRAGYCSETMGEFLYDLCRSIVGEEDTGAPQGIINDNVYLHGRNAVPRATLKLRLQMLDEAISGSRGRRTGGAVPLRFQGGLNEGSSEE